MTQTEKFIRRLEALKEGDRFKLRELRDRGPDETLQGFDLFTSLWWPLRNESPSAPRKETSWLVAKLFGAFPVPQVQHPMLNAGATLAYMLGRCQPIEVFAQRRFRRRFDVLLRTPLSELEPLLRWALSIVADAFFRKKCLGLNWVQLLEDLSIWDRGEAHRRRRDIREEWAESYLTAVQRSERS